MIRELGQIWFCQNEPNVEKTVVLRLLERQAVDLHSSSTSRAPKLRAEIRKFTSHVKVFSLSYVVDRWVIIDPYSF